MKNLCLTILIALTSSSTNAKTSPEIIHIEVGQKAPFTGALFPKYKHDTCLALAESEPKLESRIAELQDEIMGMENDVDSAQMMSFLAGAGVGGFLVWMTSILVGGKR